ncbi:hypothetical protein [Spirosoma sp.]|uniref:hypothetical protein n=1 Tax=Spirosoma sp. TaxID=1899569 RepID=UPI003B3B1C52
MRKLLATWSSLFSQRGFWGYPPILWVIWVIAIIMLFFTVNIIVAERTFNF